MSKLAGAEAVFPVIIRDLSASAVRALQIRALENSRSPDREACAILEELLCPQGRLHVGTALSGLSKESGLTNRDVEALEAAREANQQPHMWFG